MYIYVVILLNSFRVENFQTNW